MDRPAKPLSSATRAMGRRSSISTMVTLSHRSSGRAFSITTPYLVATEFQNRSLVAQKIVDAQRLLQPRRPQKSPPVARGHMHLEHVAVTVQRQRRIDAGLAERPQA